MLLFTGKFNTFYPKCVDKFNLLSYIHAPLQGYNVLDTSYGFDILRENNCDFPIKHKITISKLFILN